MRTLTTVEHVERKDSGAIVVTFLGGNKAGTYDPEVGDVAEKALAEGNPVELQVDKRQGKLFIEFLTLVEPPPELGGPEDSAETPVPAAAENEVSAETLVGPFTPASDDELVAAVEAATDQGDDTSEEAVAAANDLLAEREADYGLTEVPSSALLAELTRRYA